MEESGELNLDCRQLRISMKNLKKSFNGNMILNDINLTVYAGDIIGLVGKSGAGKSTILKIISGLISHDSGEYFSSTEKIGYVFQENRLIPWKTVIDNVTFSLIAAGYSKKMAIERAEQLLDYMTLSHVLKSYPYQLSGGMNQRVAIARALAIEPDLLLLDEPFSALDPHLKETLQEYFHQYIKENNVTTLYVSHRPEELIKMTSDIYILNDHGNLSYIEEVKGKVGDLYKMQES